MKKIGNDLWLWSMIDYQQIYVCMKSPYFRGFKMIFVDRFTISLLSRSTAVESYDSHLADGNIL